MKLEVLEYKNMDYCDSFRIQKKIQEKRINGDIPDTILLLEHKPVLTMGNRGQYENILISKDKLKEKGIQIFETDRGGDVTFHGPGQLVVYPILDLTNHGKDIRKFISMLQEVIINVLFNSYGVVSEKRTGLHTGVWIQDKKIAAIGLSISKWVTLHGFALNVNTDLSFFDLIVPCGLAGYGVTSIEKELRHVVDFSELEKAILIEFINIFGFTKVFNVPQQKVDI